MAYQRAVLANPQLRPSARCHGSCTNPELLHNPKEWTERWHEAISSLPVIEKVDGLPWSFESLRSNGLFFSVAVRRYRQLLRGGKGRNAIGQPLLFDPREFNTECIRLRWQMRMANETCSEQFARILSWFRTKARKVFTCREFDHFCDWFLRLAHYEFKHLQEDYENLEFPTLAEVTRIRMMQGFTVSHIPRSDSEIVGCGPMPRGLSHFFRPTKAEAEFEEMREFYSNLTVAQQNGPIAVKPCFGSQFTFARALDYGNPQKPINVEKLDCTFGPPLPTPKRKRSFGALQDPEQMDSDNKDVEMEDVSAQSDLVQYQFG